MKTSRKTAVLTGAMLCAILFSGWAGTLDVSHAQESEDRQKDDQADRPRLPDRQIAPTGPPAKSRSEMLRKQAPKRTPANLPAPEDVAMPPADAERAASGLAWKVLTPGIGSDRPGPNDQVTLRYTGWTTDGVMVDTTELNKRPRSFGLNRTVRGMSDGVQMMVAGEQRRLWVPESLAYAGKPDRPQGMLVFDVTLISFVEAPEIPSDLSVPPDDAQTTESGLAYRVLREGEGPSPDQQDMVVIDLNVWLPDGDLFDTTRFKTKPEHFRLDMTIPAFAELIPKMSAGARWRIWAPVEMTKLDNETFVDSPMIFDVELLRFLKKPETPVHVSAPPRDVETTITGLAFEILRPGTGDEHPSYGAEVEVNYAGWTRDGKMFDASFEHGGPGRFTLDSNKPVGWNEALMMMVVGEKRRIWIPEELAYREDKNLPQGPLVFEVELLSFTDPE